MNAKEAAKRATAAVRRWSNLGILRGMCTPALYEEPADLRLNPGVLSEMVLARGANTLIAGPNDAPSPEEFERRLAYLQELLEEIRTEEMRLLNRHYRLAYIGLALGVSMILGCLAAILLLIKYEMNYAANVVALVWGVAWFTSQFYAARRFEQVCREARKRPDVDPLLPWLAGKTAAS